MNIRNIAIIAHVDHGKTTLVDKLFSAAGTLGRTQAGSDRVMDNDDLERERGITILSKNASLTWKDVRINLIDTPGHADFGGQVERVLSMADGVLLVVDAFEGVMPQTRFVLEKAFANGLSPMVVVNKMDRHDARADAVLGEVFDLFIDLGAEEMALDFPAIYCSARDGWASLDENSPGTDMNPMLDAILENFDAPQFDENSDLQMQIATLDWNDFVGAIGIGRVSRGKITRGSEITLISNEGESSKGVIKELYHIEGMERKSCDEVLAGDIACIAGVKGLRLGATITSRENPEAMQSIEIEAPTIEMEFMVNDSPFAGKEGQFLTSRQVQERLLRAATMDPALHVNPSPTGGYLVAGRGVLHLGILIENMRREGYEFAVGSPKVLLKEVGEEIHEPFELAQVDLPNDYVGKVIEFFSKREAEINDIHQHGTRTCIKMRLPTRALIGARTHVLTLSRGEGAVSSSLEGYAPRAADIEMRHRGSLVASDTGQVTAYSLTNLEDRGQFFVAPGEQVYAGMVVGENNKDKDITLNVVRAKKMTNVRASSKDNTEKVRAAHKMSLEQFLEYLDRDELLKVTPQTLRLRKRLMNEKSRLRAEKNATAIQ